MNSSHGVRQKEAWWPGTGCGQGRAVLRLRRSATRPGYRFQGDISISANRVTFLLLDNGPERHREILNTESRNWSSTS